MKKMSRVQRYLKGKRLEFFELLTNLANSYLAESEIKCRSDIILIVALRSSVSFYNKCVQNKIK
jgi:hypothetical protein